MRITYEHGARPFTPYEMRRALYRDLREAPRPDGDQFIVLDVERVVRLDTSTIAKET